VRSHGADVEGPWRKSNGSLRLWVFLNAVYQVLEEPEEWFSLAAPNEGLAMGRECCNVARRPP
jgi:hypothetical protein